MPNLKIPTIKTFSDEADQAAQKVATSGGSRKNKSTQLRGFYDEILNWEQRSQYMNDDALKTQLPLVHMLIAKVTYAKARDHVTQEFVDLMKDCISQVDDKATLRHCKLFFEAFMGFYKLHGPK